MTGQTKCFTNPSTSFYYVYFVDTFKIGQRMLAFPVQNK